MKYYRVHTEDIAYKTKKPVGLFVAIWRLVEDKILSEQEEKEYWENREYFEKVLPVPPYYENGNPDGAITWYKDTKEGNRIFHEMSFYRRMADKYGKKLFISECQTIPGKVIYEDDFQIAVIDDKDNDNDKDSDKDNVNVNVNDNVAVVDQIEDVQIGYSQENAVQVRNGQYEENKVNQENTEIQENKKNKKNKIDTKELVWPIHEIKEEDIESCVNVIRESFATVAKQFGFTRENAPGFTAFATDEEKIKWQMNGEHRPMYGYFKDGNLVGYYSLVINDKHECELNNLCVLPKYRHQDIGEELLLDAFVRARGAGCQKIDIGIVEENQVLRKWYEDYGFIHTGTKKYDFFPFTCGYLTREL